ncbi:MAG: DUF3429 domain-containing protein [Candidatus Thiodiazotropha taylori]|nr:DUF3429 domain-containing protein [Candidatus Thiodiazotropha taylori]
MGEQQIKAVRLYGFGGVLPFLLAAAGLHITSGEFDTFFAHAFLAYGAVILSFIGAVHWGFILKTEQVEQAGKLLAIGVIPSLVGWGGLLLPPLYTLILFTFAFPSLFIYERFTQIGSLLPEWYMKLRLQLTIIVTLLHIVALPGVA